MERNKKPSNKFSHEVRARAVRMARERRGDHASQLASITAKFGCSGETLRDSGFAGPSATPACVRARRRMSASGSRRWSGRIASFGRRAASTHIRSDFGFRGGFLAAFDPRAPDEINRVCLILHGRFSRELRERYLKFMLRKSGWAPGPGVRVLDAKQVGGQWIISARQERAGFCPRSRRMVDLPARLA